MCTTDENASSALARSVCAEMCRGRRSNTNLGLAADRRVAATVADPAASGVWAHATPVIGIIIARREVVCYTIVTIIDRMRRSLRRARPTVRFYFRFRGAAPVRFRFSKLDFGREFYFDYFSVNGPRVGNNRNAPLSSDVINEPVKCPQTVYNIYYSSVVVSRIARRRRDALKRILYLATSRQNVLWCSSSTRVFSCDSAVNGHEIV